ncbi:MAG TPA: crossover junction endodeoxyribonuclease RuvC [Candidatus Agrococcus pullicola]|uniref:Crossover junction endodeoxyribonuclease RuvC n=1 Tax=Candidatus Agrococcus pullicola TaxID=2838429 RepID=A0A9D2CA14_9MICO|nr:crossover junction endodeoxyribonuclease RuvC [Candidatus Agrococcus pullicola]
MRVLGIDPGLTRLGLGVVDVTPASQELVHVSVLRTGAGEPVEQRLLQLALGLESCIDQYRPDTIALERVFAQQNLHSVMGVAQISGIALRAAAERQIPIAMMTPTAVKGAVTGYGQADKVQVGEMVRRFLRLSAPPKPADASDALALAIAHGRASVRTGVVRGSGSGEPTAAQRAWAEAEAKARRGR